MKNLIILYNPYYQSDVIEQHLKILIDKEKVAFGKVRSKLNVIENRFESDLEEIYQSVDESHHLQLFLTDYSSLFVAKIVSVSCDDMSSFAPSYYRDKNLEVDRWFVISDLRELVRDDFKTVRDFYLANFTTPNFGNHTYALYGNSYVYPLIVDMKHSINYFEDTLLHYPNVFQTGEFLDIKSNLIKYSFGTKYINYMHPDTINNIISAEIEYQQNHTNPLYDFSSVVIKYSKTIEQEIYIFMKYLFKMLAQKQPKIMDISYTVQGLEYKLSDIFHHKPNLGTYKFLLKNEMILETIESYCDKSLKYSIIKDIPYYINLIQDIRNEAVHAKQPLRDDVDKLREKIIGVTHESIIINLVKERYKKLF